MRTQQLSRSHSRWRPPPRGATGALQGRSWPRKEILKSTKGSFSLLVQYYQPNLYLEQKSIGDQWNPRPTSYKLQRRQSRQEYITHVRGTLSPCPVVMIFSMLRDYQNGGCLSLSSGLVLLCQGLRYLLPQMLDKSTHESRTIIIPTIYSRTTLQ
ncbi:Protein of unknown function [Gryllus bimaculatus]|nr:Protein of unknown function [Gryllus bimaculatus]